ncbi:MAG: hypothetical protein R2685_16195 [Candidatus Nitrosocosmicus sp.]|nr:hypothetical protein [Candidatus Nitrosocosmicus sp.]
MLIKTNSQEPEGASPQGNGGQEPEGASPQGNGGQEPEGASPQGNGGQEPEGASPQGNGGQEPEGASPQGNGGQEPEGASPQGNGGQEPEGASPTDKTQEELRQLRNKVDRLFDEEAIELKNELNLVNTRINVAIENGLYDYKSEGPLLRLINHIARTISKIRNNKSPEFDANLRHLDGGQKNEPTKILENIKIAKDKFNENKFTEAELCLSTAKREYTREIEGAPLWWKFENVYAGYVWIYLIAILAGIFALYSAAQIYDIDFKFESILSVNDPAINATAWGVIGAVLRAMWFLKTKIDHRTYRNAFNNYFISIPFIGGILGALIYLILYGGLIALSSDTGFANNPSGEITQNTSNLQVSENQTTDNDSDSQSNRKTSSNNNNSNGNSNGIDLINPLTVIPFAALAGYNWEWAIRLFNRLGDFLFEDDKNVKPFGLGKKQEF